MGVHVTFDSSTKIIQVNTLPDVNGFVYINVKQDIYSDGKEDWLADPLLNKFLFPVTAIGGDPLPGAKSLGTTFFLEYGWKIRPFEGDQTLVIEGNLYSRDDNIPFDKTIGNFNVQLISTVSNLIDTIDTSGTGDCPTAIETASAVRTELTVEMDLINTNVDTTTSSRASQASVDAMDLIVDNIDTTTTNIESKVELIQLDVTNILDVVNDIIKYHANRTFINKNNFTLTVYEADNTTPFKVYDLKNDSGVASITSIFERLPQ